MDRNPLRILDSKNSETQNILKEAPKISDHLPQESLDLLDERYHSMSKVLDIPLWHDSLEIRNVVEDIRLSRESVLQIARSLASIDETAVYPDDNTGD